MKCLICTGDAGLAEKARVALESFAQVEVAAETPARLDGQDLLVVDSKALARLERMPDGLPVVAVLENLLGEPLEALVTRPWLAQVLSPEALDGGRIARVLYGLVHKEPGLPPDTLAFLGPRRIRARRVFLYRSADIARRLDRLQEAAEEGGARRRALDQIHDIANELLSNAFYDAPYEGGLFARPPEREQQITLPPDVPCELVYGSLDDEFFLRVRDCFGALTRPRLLEVLSRCAQGGGAIPLDESRGGAGLGLWRIFRQSSQLVLSVVPRVSTEMLVTVPKSGLARDLRRSWHLMFAAPETRKEAGVRQP
jgi:hypothetical protein